MGSGTDKYDFLYDTVGFREPLRALGNFRRLQRRLSEGPEDLGRPQGTLRGFRGQDERLDACKLQHFIPFKTCTRIESLKSLAVGKGYH